MYGYCTNVRTIHESLMTSPQQARNGNAIKPGAQAWEDRYSTDHYVYGTEPNDFLAQVVRALPTGRALCLADSEGRNGVYLASLGYDVTSMDQTKAGIEKTMALAVAAQAARRWPN